MSAIITMRQRFNNAKHFVNESNIFVSLGGQDEWSDETAPGIPTGDELVVPTPVMFKEADIIKYAKVDINGDLDYAGVTYLTTEDEQEARDNNFTYVYVQAEFYKDKAPVGAEFRVVGVHTNVDAITDNEGYAYPAGTEGVPNVVHHEGDLSIINYRRVVTRHDDQIERASAMIEF